MARMQTWFDSLVHPQWVLWGKTYDAYQVLGFIGLVAGFAWMLWLSVGQGLELPVTAGLVLLAYLVFLGIGWLNRVLFGQERLALMEQVAIILGVCSVFLTLIARPRLAYLDILVLGLCLMLAIGRLGCLLAGCCHGRPAKTGVRYGADYDESGLPAYLLHRRLFPLQLVEAGWLAVLAVLGSVYLSLGNSSPGEVLGIVVAGYCLGRFFIEFWRGDAHRPYIDSLSLNQWLSLLAGVLCFLLLKNLSSSVSWVVLWGSVGLWAVAVATLVIHRISGLPVLDSPRFLARLQQTRWKLQSRLVEAQHPVVVEEMPGGLLVGLSRAASGWHYSLSRRGRPLQRWQAQTLVNDLALLHGLELNTPVEETQPGLFQCFLPKTILPLGQG